MVLCRWIYPIRFKELPMKTVFGGAIALALVLFQPLRAEDPKTDKTDGDQKRILAGANEDPGQEIAPVELKTCKSLLAMSKKASERAAKLQQMAAERLELIAKDYADTPEGKEAARLLFFDNSTGLPSDLDSARLNVTPGNIKSKAAPDSRSYRLYSVREKNGEMLYQIAQHTLGTSDRWYEIALLNPQLKPEQPVPYGEKVKLPPDVTADNIKSVAAPPLPNKTEDVTRVDGPSALLVELVDLDDPVEVGVDTAYYIRVTNTGWRTETNVQLACVMPDKMEFRGARASANWKSHLQGREVVFEPFFKLCPRADVLYRVDVRSIAPGDLRFQARVTADGLTNPILKEWHTKVYGHLALPK
jgi:hypothetical protein